MIIVRLVGGLGNQMFQYAAGRALADRLDVELVLDIRDFKHYRLHAYGLESFRIRARRATADELAAWPEWRRRLARWLKRVTGSGRIYVEPFFGYDSRWPTLGDGVHLNGYFQSANYFSETAACLRKDFTPVASLTDANAEIAEMAQNSESVAIHVRRGDYVSDAKTLRIHGVCSPAYYAAAIARMRERRGKVRFFVFSNDVEWSQENLPLGDDAVFVEGNGGAPEIDIHLMAHCRHHIVANSSFSWWGAWLAGHPEQSVIAPSPWFDSSRLTEGDLIPSNWSRLSKQ